MGIYKFSGAGTFTLPRVGYKSMLAGKSFFGASVNVEYLVVAGGGGSASTGSGSATYGSPGGGAGGYRSSVVGETSGGNASAEQKANFLLGQNYLVTVGAGGAINSNGVNSVLDSIVSLGGGASYANGGSGGGGDWTIFGQSSPQFGTGTSGQGFSGGPGRSGDFFGGGGGGAGEAGNTDSFGSGGDGLASLITGSSIIRAGGGSGGGNTSTNDGGGARGASSGGDNNGFPGTENTGGGAGGSFLQGGGTSTGSTGGSGIVILRYPNTVTITIGAGLTGTTGDVGSNKVTTITAGTGNVSWT